MPRNGESSKQETKNVLCTKMPILQIPTPLTAPLAASATSRDLDPRGHSLPSPSLAAVPPKALAVVAAVAAAVRPSPQQLAAIRDDAPFVGREPGVR